MNILIQETAKKDLKKLPKKTVETVLRKLHEIRNNPLHFIERLKGYPLWKLRIGEYRAILHIITKEETIHVLKIGHRKDVYKHI